MALSVFANVDLKNSFLAPGKDVIFGITQKPLYVTSSNLVRQYMTNKVIFLNLFCNLKSNLSLVSGPFCLLKGTGLESKNNVNFLRSFENRPSKYLNLKELLACNSCFGFLIKNENWSRFSFWCTFSALCYYKNVPYLIIYYQLTKFECYTIFSF